jgi:hypothetical protein
MRKVASRLCETPSLVESSETNQSHSIGSLPYIPDLQQVQRHILQSRGEPNSNRDPSDTEFGSEDTWVRYSRSAH